MSNRTIASGMLTAEDVVWTLEQAGMTLLRLRARGLFPAKCRSSWPDILYDSEDRRDWTSEAPRWAPPTPDAIALMDAVAPWPLHVEDVGLRRLVQARSLVHPMTGRHLYSWRRLGTVTGLHHETVKARHAAAIDRIVAAVNR